MGGAFSVCGTAEIYTGFWWRIPRDRDIFFFFKALTHYAPDAPKTVLMWNHEYPFHHGFKSPVSYT
jgi:hypothetical protein